MRLPRPATLPALALAAALAGCKDSPTAPAPTAAVLVLVQGDAQVRQAGRRLHQPLVFRALDGGGLAVSGVPVTTVVAQGGGAVDSASARTDANGEVRIRWTLGPTAAQALTATAPGAPPVRASATALLPADVVVVQGNNQTARPGTALPNAIVLRVLGAGNVPLDSTAVTLQISAGGGTVSPQSVLTNGAGEATVRWTLGAAAGPNTAFVRVGTLEPVVLSATAAP